MAKSENKKRLSKKQKTIIGLSIGLIVACALVLVYLFVMNYKFFEDKSGTGVVSIGKEIQTPEPVQEKMVSFLVLGVSDDPAERGNTMLTDTIMVATVDIEAQKVSILQIPRDTYVGEETSTGKINAIYKQNPEKWDYAGLQGLIDKIYEMFKVNIDHYVTIQMDGFADVIDLIGGVTMNVPKDMELNGTFVPAGERTLTGEEAIAVVRTRNVYANADLGRLDTQKIFLSALVEKCMSLGFSDMTKLIPTMMRSITTDLTVNQVLSYYNVTKSMDMSNMVIMTAPGAGAMVNGQAVYSLYQTRTANLLNEYFRPYTDPVPAEQLEMETIYDDPGDGQGRDDNVVHFDDYSDSSTSSSE